MPLSEDLIKILSENSPIILHVKDKQFSKLQKMPMSKWEALPDDHKTKIKKFVGDRNRDALAPLDENQLDEVRKNIIKYIEEVPDQPPSDAGPSDPEPSDPEPSDPEPSDPPEPLDQPPSDPEPSDPPEPLDQPPSDPEPSDPQTDGKISKDGGEKKEDAQPNENTDGGEKKEDAQPNENTDGGEEKKNMSEKPVEKMTDAAEESATNLISNGIDNMDDVAGMHEVRENSVDIAPDFVQTFFNFINSLVDSPSETTNGQCKPIVEQATIDNVSDASNVSNVSNTSDVSTAVASSVGTTATAMGVTVQQEQATAPENMLPEGWSEHVSQSSDPGKKYYVNESTGETTWDRPGGNAGEKTNEPTGPKETGDNKLPEGWSEHVSQSSDPGKKYYVNETTGETTWDRPGGNEGEKTNEPTGPKETGDDKLPEGWSEHISQSSDPGKKYYVNETTGETTWDRPGGNKGEDKPLKPKEPSSAAVPAGWTAHVSESSDPGRIYYVNDTTGETTWTKPTVMDNWVKKTSQNVQPGKEYYENTTTGNTRWAPPLMPSNDDECNQCKKKGKMPHTSFFIKNNRAQKVCFCSIECFEKTEF